MNMVAITVIIAVVTVVTVVHSFVIANAELNIAFIHNRVSNALICREPII